MLFFRRHLKPFAITSLLVMLFNILLPNAAWAITGGDSMPEYQSFEPATTSNMVNVFDGSFTYNIPLLEVPNGYPISLSYHSGDVSNEAQSSWVGLGWTLNAGAINRAKRGIPDDFKEKKVTYYNKYPDNWTFGLDGGLSKEIFGKEGSLGNLTAGISFNNRNGFSTNVGLAGSYMGLGLNMNYGQGRFGFSGQIPYDKLLNPSKQKEDQEKKEGSVEKRQKQYESLKRNRASTKTQYHLRGAMNLSNSPSSFPIPVSRYAAFSGRARFDGSVKFAWLPLEFLIGTAGGSFSVQGNVKPDNNSGLAVGEERKTVNGYLYSEKSVGNAASMMDYSTDQDGTFERRTKYLGVPLVNSDFFSVSGQGIGGSFRAVRNEIGHYRKADPGDSRTWSLRVGVDVDPAAPLLPPLSDLAPKFGGNLGGGYQEMSVGGWKFQGGNATNAAGSLPMPAGAGGNAKEIADFQFGNALQEYAAGNSPERRKEEPYAFRFAGDMGGWSDPQGITADRDEPEAADIVISDLHYEARLTGLDAYGQRTRTGKSTFIGHMPNSVWAGVTAAGTPAPLEAHEKSLFVMKISLDANENIVTGTPADYNRTRKRFLGGNQANDQYDSRIGEFAISNESGATYVYGLPLYTRNERNYSFDLNVQASNEAEVEDNGLIATIKNGVYTPAGRKWLNGSETTDAYASQYLLTQITGADYIDRTNNGPTPDDFGSYSRFNYVYTHGYESGNATWYAHRAPFKKVSYSKGQLSRPEDDRGSVEYSEKEIYYLHSVVSKTHVAIFTVGPRKDGLGAPVKGDMNGVVTSDTSGTGTPLMCLQKIDLYALGDCNKVSGTDGCEIYTAKPGSKPIKTVYFEYDYSLSQKVPTSKNTALGTTGKLTLKRVWFTYNGVTSAKLSAYTFHYQYPTTAVAPYPGKYQSMQSEYTSFTAADQNPDYKVENSDRWGNFRAFQSLSDKLGRLARYFPFVMQYIPAKTVGSSVPAYDPAAYCLKRIELPTGGEIHIQYEQNDYLYVQNQRAMAMVPLNATATPTSETADKRYYLDLSALGIDYTTLTGSQPQVLADELFEPMARSYDRLYFNFLYDLTDPTPNTTNPDNAHSEFIDGYAQIKGYGWDGSGIYFYFRGNPPGSYREIGYPSKATPFEIPRKACKDFYKTQRNGMVTGESSIMENAIKSASTIEGVADAFFANLFGLAGTVTNLLGEKMQHCECMSPAMSYVRIQVPVSMDRTLSMKPVYGKLGGGVRVKRLLMYDQNTSLNSSSYSADPVVYGSEYDYTTTVNGRRVSSGVATYEPAGGNQENPLVNPIDLEKWTFSFGEPTPPILYGRDTYNKVGPIGESFYPSPSVGYSTVTVRNIHSGETSTGYTVHEFYTCREYPLIVQHTPVHMEGGTPIGIGAGGNGMINGTDWAGGASYRREIPFCTQGYSIISNGMHGQIRQVTAYNQPSRTGSNGAFKTPVTRQSFEYYQPATDQQAADLVPVMNGDGHMDYVPLGRECEVYAEHSRSYEFSASGDVNIDFTTGVGIWNLSVPPIPMPTLIPTSWNVNASVSERGINTHVTVKQISYPVIVKKAVQEADGIAHITENVAFDLYSGSPVLTRSYDEYGGSYFSQNFMASWHHPSMGQKAQNQDIEQMYASPLRFDYQVNTGAFAEVWQITLPITSDCELPFTRGDMLRIGLTSGGVLLGHVLTADVAAGVLTLLPSALNTGNAAAANGQTVVSSIRVMHSGYTNQLTQPDGSLMAHYSPGQSPANFAVAASGRLLDDQHPLAQAFNNGFDAAFANGGIAASNASGSFNVFNNPSQPIPNVNISGWDACTVDPGGCNPLRSLDLGFAKSTDHNRLALNIAGAAITGKNGVPQTATGCGVPLTPYNKRAKTNCTDSPIYTSIYTTAPCNATWVAPTWSVPPGPVNYYPVTPYPAGEYTGHAGSGQVAVADISLQVNGGVISGTPLIYDPAAGPLTFQFKLQIKYGGKTNYPWPRDLVCDAEKVEWTIDGIDMEGNKYVSYNSSTGPLLSIFTSLPKCRTLSDPFTFPSYLPAGVYNVRAKPHEKYGAWLNSSAAKAGCNWGCYSNDLIAVVYVRPVNLPAPSPSLFDQARVDCVPLDAVTGLPIGSGKINGKLKYNLFPSGSLYENPLFSFDGSGNGGNYGYNIDYVLTNTGTGNIVSSGELQTATGDFSLPVSTPGNYTVSIWIQTPYCIYPPQTYTQSFVVPGCACSVFPSAQSSSGSVVTAIGPDYEVNLSTDANYCLVNTPVALYHRATDCSLPPSATASFKITDITSGAIIQDATGIVGGPINLPNWSFTTLQPVPLSSGGANVFTFNKATHAGGQYEMSITTTYAGQPYLKKAVIKVLDARSAQATITNSTNYGSYCTNGRIVTLQVNGKCGVTIGNSLWEYRDVVASGTNTNPWTSIPAVSQTATGISFQMTGCDAKEVRAQVSNDYGSAYTPVITVPGNTAYPCHTICSECGNQTMKPLDIHGYETLTSGQKFSDYIGKWYVNLATGDLVFKRHDCARETIFPCVKACATVVSPSQDMLMESVVSAEAVTFSDELMGYRTNSELAALYPLTGSSTYASNANLFECGAAGKWLPHRSYTYRTTTNPNNEQYAFEQGRYKLKLFNWLLAEESPELLPEEWVLTSTVQAYTPNSEVWSESDILGIPSSSHYGYGGKLMTMVSQNGNTHETLFEAFENATTTTGDEGLNIAGTSLAITGEQKHTGALSLKIGTTTGNVTLKSATFAPASTQKLMVRFWARALDANRNALTPQVNISGTTAGSYNVSLPVVKVASSGEWGLYECIVDRGTSGWLSADGFKVTASGAITYLDDFRVQPFEAEATCYVYDKQQRLLAVMDDQHFGALYQYNDQGILIRKLKETHQGIKTLSESFSNSSK